MTSKTNKKPGNVGKRHPDHHEPIRYLDASHGEIA